MRLEVEIAIGATPERVWPILTDWERQATWMPDVAWIRVVGPQRGPGTRLKVRTKVFGMAAVTDQVRVVVWEPPSRVVAEHRGLVAGIGEWLLEEAGEGTRLTWREALRMPPPVLGDLALWVYRPWQRWMLRRSLENLRGLVERTG